MLNILIAEGTPAVWQAERAGFGLPSNFSLIAAAVQLHQPDAHYTPLNIADGEALPYGITLSDFDGVMFPGSPLHIYDSDPCVTRQIDFARTAFAAGVPVWGSCWGLQLAVVALGGSVRRNPRGRELPIARAITVTDTGRAHPLLASRPAVFDALCSHLDEIETLPPNSQVLAANEVSAVQAIAAQTSGRGSFHGTQYHPEHTFAVSAALVEMRAAELCRRGPRRVTVRDRRDRRRLSRFGCRAYPPRPDLALWDCARDYGSGSPHCRDRQLAADRRRAASGLNLAATVSVRSPGGKIGGERGSAF